MGVDFSDGIGVQAGRDGLLSFGDLLSLFVEGRGDKTS